MKKKLLVMALALLMTGGVIMNASSLCYGTIKAEASTTEFKGSLYSGTIEGTGVRFRKSPKISSSNIIRTFSKGEKIWVYATDLSCKYADGYWWSYVEDKNGKHGYVATKYISTDHPA